MYNISRFTGWIITLILVAFLAACEPKESVEATLPDDKVANVDLAVDTAAPAVGFVTQAKLDNESMAQLLYDAKPFADDTMPQDSDRLLTDVAKIKSCTDLAFPTKNCEVNGTGYPVYELVCNLKTRECLNTESNTPVGTVDELAQVQSLTLVRNVDVLNEQYICDGLCVDAEARVIGVVEPAMQSWINRVGQDFHDKSNDINL